MGIVSRGIVALLSAGWVVPLGVAGYLAVEGVALIDHAVAPYSERFDRFMWARSLLALSSIWLFAVVAGWTYVAAGALVFRQLARAERDATAEVGA